MLRQSFIFFIFLKGAKVLAKEPNPRVPHLVSLPELGSEDRRATP